MEYDWIGELRCDECGAQGAYDVDGDYLCDYCISASEFDDEDEEDDE